MSEIGEDPLQLSGSHLEIGSFLLPVLLFYKGCIVEHLTVQTVKVDWSFPYKAGASYQPACEDVIYSFRTMQSLMIYKKVVN